MTTITTPWYLDVVMISLFVVPLGVLHYLDWRDAKKGIPLSKESTPATLL